MYSIHALCVSHAHAAYAGLDHVWHVMESIINNKKHKTLQPLCFRTLRDERGRERGGREVEERDRVREIKEKQGEMAGEEKREVTTGSITSLPH